MTRSAKPTPKRRAKPASRRAAPMSFSIEHQQLRELDAMAREKGSTRSGLVKIAIARLLRDGI